MTKFEAGTLFIWKPSSEDKTHILLLLEDHNNNSKLLNMFDLINNRLVKYHSDAVLFYSDVIEVYPKERL